MRVVVKITVNHRVEQVMIGINILLGVRATEEWHAERSGSSRSYFSLVEYGVNRRRSSI